MKRIKTSIQQTLAALDRAVFRVLSGSRAGALLYYRLFSGSFNREMWAVAQGRRQHDEQLSGAEGTSFVLRRNIHRLEKGLSSRPRRDVFAADYIGETVDVYDAILQRGIDSGVDLREMRWAKDVLTVYFDETGAHPALDAARARFRALPEALLPEGDLPARVAGPDPLAAPYRRTFGEAPPVDYDALLSLARQRRSVRWFRPEPVPRELVDRAIEVATLSPSACNRQPYTFRIYDDPELLAQVAVQPGGARGFAHNLQMMVVVVGRQRAYFDERDRHVIYIDGSLASMSFLLACETLGLSTCCINWPDLKVQEKRIADIMGLDPDERVIMFIAVGFPDPDALIPYSAKKPLASLRAYN